MLRNVFTIAAALGLWLAASQAVAESVSEPRDCVISPFEVVDLGSAVPGQLEDIDVERSDTVRKGQILARLESGVERASLELALAWASIDSEQRIEQTTGALDRRRNDRISRLYATQAVALDDKDRAETDATLSALRVRQAGEKRWIRELDANKARAALERRTVRSPIDGVVVERYRSAGEYVENQPIVRIARLDPLYVETILPMSLFGQVQPGMVAEVQPENTPGEGHRAVVALVDRMGDAASGTFGVRLSLPNPDGLIPAGLRCTLQIDSAERAPIPGLSPNGPADAGQSESTEPVISPAPATAVEADPRNELPLAPSRQEDTPVAASVVAHAEDVTPIDCSAIGPIQSDDRARALADRLSGLGRAPRVERALTAEPFGYIVVTPPEPDLDAAKQLARRLSAIGVHHMQVMHRGDFVNRVSLGVYAGADMAQRRIVEVQALGVHAELLPRTRSRQRWWVRVDLSAAQSKDALGPELIGDLSLASEACDADLHRAEGRLAAHEAS